MNRNLKRIDKTIYETNLKFILKKLDQVLDSDPIDTRTALISINQLYFFMINSGFLNDIYMDMFIRLNGMKILRKVQNFIFNSKN